MQQLYNVCKMLDRHKCKHSYVLTTIRSLVRSFACLYVANALQEERQHNKFFIAHQEKHLPMHWQTTMHCQLNSNTNWFLFFLFSSKAHLCALPRIDPFTFTPYRILFTNSFACVARILKAHRRFEPKKNSRLYSRQVCVCAVRAYMCNIYGNQQ